MSTRTATPATNRPAVAPSYAGLRRRERAAFRALNEAFRTLQLLDRAGCDADAYLRVSALYRAACAEHTAAVAACLAHPDDRPPTPPAGPAAGRLADLGELEALQREARAQHAPSDRGRLVEFPYAAFADSIEGGDALARLHEGDPLDLVGEWEPPY